MEFLKKYKPLVLGVFAVLAPIVAYLFQVDPLSLCVPAKQDVTGRVVVTNLDAGIDVK